MQGAELKSYPQQTSCDDGSCPFQKSRASSSTRQREAARLPPNGQPKLAISKKDCAVNPADYLLFKNSKTSK